MLTETLNNLSTILNIDPAIIPNIITLIVVVIILFVSLKSQLSWATLLILYTLSMAIMSLLGIDSVFNLLTLIESWVTS